MPQHRHTPPHTGRRTTTDLAVAGEGRADDEVRVAVEQQGGHVTASEHAVLAVDAGEHDVEADAEEDEGENEQDHDIQDGRHGTHDAAEHLADVAKPLDQEHRSHQSVEAWEPGHSEGEDGAASCGRGRGRLGVMKRE